MWKSSWSFTVKRLIVVLVLFLLPTSLIAQGHTNFIFNQFNASTLELYGNASVESNAISLNGRFQFSIGRAFYPYPVRMKDPGSLNSTFSFSTTFVFSIVPPSASQPGFGLAFMMTPQNSLKGFYPSPYLGLISNLSVMGKPSNHLFAVEFDTVRNMEFHDINYNHVGVDLNDLWSVNSTPAGYWINSSRFQDLDLKSGRNIQAWIDYDDPHKELKVTIAEAGLDRPQKPLLHMKNMSLSNILEEEMYVGFSAATASIYEENYILAWSFATNGISPSLNTSSLPSFIHKKSKSSNYRLIAGVSTACVVLVVVVTASLVRLKRNWYLEVIEE